MSNQKQLTPEELHEMDARKNALNILLNNSMPAAVEHLECVISAILEAQPTEMLEKICNNLRSNETLSPSLAPIITVQGELDINGKVAEEPSERQKWRVERDELQEKLAAANITNDR